LRRSAGVCDGVSAAKAMAMSGGPMVAKKVAKAISAASNMAGGPESGVGV